MRDYPRCVGVRREFHCRETGLKQAEDRQPSMAAAKAAAYPLQVDADSRVNLFYEYEDGSEQPYA